MEQENRIPTEVAGEPADENERGVGRAVQVDGEVGRAVLVDARTLTITGGNGGREEAVRGTANEIEEVREVAISPAAMEVIMREAERTRRTREAERTRRARGPPGEVPAPTTIEVPGGESTEGMSFAKLMAESGTAAKSETDQEVGKDEKKDETRTEKRECIVCCERKRSAVHIGCGHVVMCSERALNLIRTHILKYEHRGNKLPCPICKKRSGIQKPFYS